MEEQAYLEPGFDPSTLTVPQLRSVLVAHSVNYPASAKKNQLIELFNANVVPQARKLRAASLRVKRTSRGIEDVPASQDVDEDEEEEQEPPRPATGRRSGGRSSRARTEEVQEVLPPTKSTRHSTAPPEATPKRRTSKHARAIEETTEPEPEPESKRPASRKSRQSAQTPVVKSERDDEGSPFSTENVFQSGSSPPAPTDRRRTTTSTSTAKDAERRRSRDVRRRTDEVRQVRPQMDGAVVPTRKTFDMPVSAMKNEAVEPTEEFTPEEQQELALQQRRSGEVVPFRPRPSGPVAKTARNSAGAVAVALLAACGYLWGQEKVQVGYCDYQNPSTEIAGVEIPKWADIIRPQCEPCPPHAICYENLQTTCEPGFNLTYHPLSLGGKLPLPPTCVPDTLRAKKVHAVRERVVEDLREQNAKYECGEASSPELKESKLKQDISKKRHRRMSNQEFEDLWESALGEVRSIDEVTQGAEGSGDITLRSSSLRNISFVCSIRRSIRQTLREYVWQLITVLLIASSGAYGRFKITSGRETETRAKQLAGVAYEKLSLQAALHASDPDTYRDDYIPMAQLRDDLLRDEYSTTRRKKLWEKVQQKVEHNANVRPMVREGRSGDVGRVWEWVGAIGMIESPPASHDRRKSGRVSFGGEQLIMPRGEDSSEMSQVSRWKEGGQYY